MTQPWQTTLAVFASGAHVLGAIVLLVLNPRSREVRWFALFIGILATWLMLLSGAVNSPAFMQSTVARALPAVFLAFSLIVWRADTSWFVLAAVVIAAIGVQPLASAVNLDDQLRLAIWIAASVLLWRSQSATRSRDSRWLIATLAVFAPVIVIASILGGSAVMDVVLPLASIGMLVLVFVGIVRHRLYEIEVRVARSGALLTEASSQDRLALLGELAASFAHEVRNPLTGVSSLAQRLAEDDVPEDKRRRYAAVIVGEVERVEALVTRLLTLARRSLPPDQPPVDVPIAPLFDDVSLLVQSRANSASVNLQMDGGGQVARGSREGLAQVLLNLVLNAIANSPPGGAVRCAACEDGSAVVITVSDQGKGVAPDARERLFAPFESAGSGIGLGLAVSRRLVEEMGGSIAIRDAPGGGARFEIRLVKAPTVDLIASTLLASSDVAVRRTASLRTTPISLEAPRDILPTERR